MTLAPSKSATTTDALGPRLALITTALLFSTGGAAVKATALSGFQVASLRSGVAVLVLLLLLPAARRGWTRRTLVVGVAYAVVMVLFVLTNKLTTAANAIFLQATAPLYVLVLSPWLLGEKVRRRDLAFMVALVFGIACFFLDLREPSATASDPWLGNLLGVALGLGWGLTIFGLRWLESKTGSCSDGEVPAGSAASAVLAGNLFAFLACLPLALSAGGTQELAGMQLQDGLVVVYLGAVQIALAYRLLTSAVRYVGAFEVSLLLLVEPTFSPLWAWWLHAEVPGLLALVGGAIILTSTVAHLWAGRSSL